MSSHHADTESRASGRGVVVSMWALLLLAPVCAEYLWGYDDSTGNPLVLVENLVIFVPLYGAPALLIREVARRRGLGWPGLLLLAAAAGLLQAGLIDQSMFSENYRAIPFWDDITVPTRIEALGISAYTTLTFVGGHVVLSFGAPIALVEALSPHPRRPWLRTRGIVIAGVAYLAAATLVLNDHLVLESEHVSTPEAVITALVVIALVAAGLRLRSSRHELDSTRDGGAAPTRPILVGVVGLVAGSANTVLAASWLGTTSLALVAALVATWAVVTSRRRAWTLAHSAALAGGALASVTLASYLADPLGDVGRLAQYAHDTTMLLLVLGLTALCLRRTRSPSLI